MSKDNVSFVIVTGLSGAGKTQAMKALEDLDYFCTDNLPPQLLAKLVEIHATAADVRDFAVAMDVRGKEHFADLSQALEWLDASGHTYKIVFLDCKDSILIRRFSETRRRHPLSQEASLQQSISAERKLLGDIRERAHVIIDTSVLKPGELKATLNAILIGEPMDRLLKIDVLSFGFKYGVPNDADIIFDVRFLPNPHYIPELKPYSGMDSCVAEYVLKWPQTQEFLTRFYDLVVGLIPAYSEEGKARLTLGIGCTGGKHRSVAIGIELAERLRQDGYQATIRHRDSDGIKGVEQA